MKKELKDSASLKAEIEAGKSELGILRNQLQKLKEENATLRAKTTGEDPVPTVQGRSLIASCSYSAYFWWFWQFQTAVILHATIAELTMVTPLVISGKTWYTVWSTSG